jgi:glycosyltransferase involved in cell wall biosynthesis
MSIRVLVVIPARDEESNLAPLLQEVRKAGYDAIVINDDSRDATAIVAKAAGFPVLTLPINLGTGGSVQTGFIYGMQRGYDIVVQIDGDGQHDPAQIQNIIAPILAGEADCVIGSRYLPDAPDRHYTTPITRRLGMHFSTALLRLASGLWIYDTTSGFRALSRPAFSYFANAYPVDHPEAEALLMLHQRGFRIREAPARLRPRSVGRSQFTFFRAVLYPARVIVGFLGVLFKGSREDVS